MLKEHKIRDMRSFLQDNLVVLLHELKQKPLDVNINTVLEIELLKAKIELLSEILEV